MNDKQAIELEDLKTAWATLEDRVETDFARVEALALDLARDKTRTLVRRAMLPPIVDLAAEAVALAIVLSGFSHAGSWIYHACLAGCAGVLAALMAAAAAQIAMLAGLDPAAPVLSTQRRLGRVRAFRIFEWKWVLLLAPVLWTPFFVAGIELLLKTLFGDGPETSVFAAGYVGGSMVIGAALTLLLIRLSGWAARRFADTPFLRGFVDDLAGRRLTAATDFLRRLDGFERE